MKEKSRVVWSQEEQDSHLPNVNRRENKEDWGVAASKSYPLIMRLCLFSGPVNG
jgi:hypothetical protein